MSQRHRVVLAVVAGFLALNAWLGAIGLATGVMDVGARAASRLPFGSPVLGGLALAIVVAVPTTLLTVAALRCGTEQVRELALAVGGIVAAWILVELAFLRELSLLHPAIFLYGVGLVVWGRRGLPALRRDLRRPLAALHAR